MAQAGTELTSWQGEPAVRFFAGGYEALIIPGVGANLIELKNPSMGVDLLRTPAVDIETFKGRPQVYGIPVLFFPNRIEDGTFKVDGKVYNFPINEPNNNHNHIHGFLHKAAWTITRAEAVSDCAAEAEAVFKADRATDFYKYLPHEFEIRMLYKLDSEGLYQKVTIINQSASAMPIGLGFHTAFNTPFHSGSSADDCSIRVAAGDRWEFSERLLPTGRLLPQENEADDFRTKGVKTQGHQIAAHFKARPLRLKDRELNGAIIEDEAAGLRLVYEAGQDYKHWMVWNESGASGFICPEPQTWVVNAPNVRLPAEETGFRLLKPDEKWEDFCRIYVEKI